MDADPPSYPSAKRRRTSSQGYPSTRSSSPQPTLHHNPSVRRTDTYSRSRTRSPRSPSHDDRRRRISPSSASDYSPRARSPTQSRSPSRSRSRDWNRDGDQPYTRYDSQSPSQSPLAHDATKRAAGDGRKHSSQKESRTLKYIPFFTIPKAHARGITAAKFSPDGALLATASADATICVWSVGKLPNLQGAQEVTSEEMEIDTNPNPPYRLLRTLRAHLSGVNALAWSPLHSHTYTLASASDDKSILLWQPLTSDFPLPPSPLLGHSNYVFSLAFSPKGNMLVSGSHDEAVFLWNVRNGTIMRKLPAHSDPVGGVDFVADGSMVCSCSTDGLIRIWDAGTGQCLRTLVDEDRKGVSGVVFVPNGRFVVGWSLDGAVRLWRVGEGRCVKTYSGHLAEGFGVGGCLGRYLLGEDGEEAACVVSGSEDGSVWVWDVSTKDVLWKGSGQAEGEAHRDVVLGVDWCRPKDGDGRGLLVSVGKDRDVRVWSEDATANVLRAWREREESANARDAAAGGVGGYALEEDDEEDDVDEQIRQMQQHQQAEHDSEMRHGEDVQMEDEEA